MRQLVFDQPQRVAQWVYSRLPHADDATAFNAIGLEHNGEIIVGVVYNSYTGFDIDMTVAANRGVLWRTRWIVPMFRYPFVQLGCRRVSARCATLNHKSASVLLHLGFKPEGYLRDALPDDDMVMFGMTRNECRWLEMLQ